MPEKIKSRVPLIVDPDLTFLESIRNDPLQKNAPSIFANTGKEAQLIIATGAHKFSGIFINPDITRPGGISVIRCAHQHQPTTPVFLIYDNTLNLSEDEMKQLGVQKALPKPVPYKDLLALVKPVTSFFDFATAPEKTESAESVDTEISATDAQFQGISADDFVAGSKSFFDVYVRLTSGKFLKLLQAGDGFAPERLEKYIKNGVTHFYLKKEDQERYLNYCDKLTSTLLDSKKVSIDFKVAQTLNQGEETLSFFRNNGISEVNIQYASHFIGNVQKLVKELNPGQSPLLKGFLHDVAAYDHGIGVSVIAGLLIHTLNITSAEPVETIGMAGMFHDIGLKALMPDFKEEDEHLLTKEQLSVFQSHPLESAKILSTIPKIKQAALQAVEQHHERRNRKGFPHHLGPGSISIISEVVGISDEFFRLIKRRETDPKLEFKQELETRILGSFSTAVVTPFRKVFLGVTTEPIFRFKSDPTN